MKKIFIPIITLLFLVSCVSEISPSMTTSSQSQSSGQVVSSSNQVLYNVIFVTNGGTPINSFQANRGSLIQQPNTTKVGNSLEGWYQSNDNGNTLSTMWNFSSDRVNSNLTLYANWAVNNYTISFNTNGGSDVQSITQPYGRVVNKPLNPTKTGFVFDNWFKESSLFNPYVFSTMPAENITVFAKWNVSNVNVTSISFQYDQIGLKIGETYSITATVSPQNATNKSLTWTSSNTSVATVSSLGVVTARLEGRVVIRATSINGISKTASVAVRYDVNNRRMNEVEPNNTRSLADAILANGTTVSGRNSSKSDIDYFKVDLITGDIITIIFASNYSVDERYYLIGLEDSRGTLLTAIYGNQEILQETVTASGTYYIGILYSSESPYSDGDIYTFYAYWF